MRQRIVITAAMAVVMGSYWQSNVRGQSLESTAAARQAAISMARKELHILKQQINELQANCGHRQANLSLETSDTARWLVVGSRHMWIPASQVSQSTGTMTAGRAIPQRFVGRTANLSIGTFGIPRSGSGNFGLGGVVMSSRAEVGVLPSMPFATVGNHHLPSSPYTPHASYSVYSEGAFAHQNAAATAVPNYTTKQFRGSAGFLTTTSVPYYAGY